MTAETFDTAQDRKQFRSLFSVVTQFRDLDSEMPVQQMQVLCWVALNEGKTQRDLRTSLDMPSSTSSRNIAALSKVHRLGKEGLGLIDFVDDPEDRRAKRLWLTPKGRAFINKLLATLG